MPADDVLRFKGSTRHDPTVGRWFAARPLRALVAAAYQAFLGFKTIKPDLRTTKQPG